MDSDYYQYKAAKPNKYPAANSKDPNAVNFCILRLSGEVSRISHTWADVIEGRLDSVLARETLRFEVGDVVRWAAQLAKELGMDFSKVLEASLEKIHDETVRNQLGKPPHV